VNDTGLLRRKGMKDDVSRQHATRAGCPQGGTTRKSRRR
jgi:hypothetical protein